MECHENQLKQKIRGEIMMTEILNIEKLRELVKPFTKEQFEELEKNTFQSPYDKYREYNGMKFKVLSEHFDDDAREAFGSECSAAWFGKNGEVLSDRYFEIQFENGKTLTAEWEELSGYYVETNQVK